MKNNRSTESKKQNKKEPTNVILGEFKLAKPISKKNFSSEVKKIADKTKCKFLFDVPRHLMDQKSGFVAALLSFNDKEPALFFVVFSPSNEPLRVVEQAKVPRELANFAWSFANVLSLVGNMQGSKKLA